MAALKIALIVKPKENVEKQFVEETAYNQFVHLAKKPRIETSNEPKIPAQVNNKRIVKDLQNFLKTYPTRDPKSQYTLEFDESNFRQCTVVVNEMPKGLLHTQLKLANKKLKFEVTFPDDYPFKPPFIRVLEPVLIGGNVHPGGALCLEFLTSDKWAPAWTLELAIIQITTALANDNRGTRILHNGGGFGVNQNSLENARRSFAKIERLRPWYDYARDKLS